MLAASLRSRALVLHPRVFFWLVRLPTGGTDAPKPQLFLLVLRAERPLNVRAIRATMALMAPWHSLLLLVLLNEAQTRADQRGLPAQPPIDKVCVVERAGARTIGQT